MEPPEADAGPFPSNLSDQDPTHGQLDRTDRTSSTNLNNDIVEPGSLADLQAAEEREAKAEAGAETDSAEEQPGPTVHNAAVPEDAEVLRNTRAE